MNTSGIDRAKVEAEIMSDAHIKDTAKELALMPYFQIKDKELSEAQVIEYVFMAGAKSKAAKEYWQRGMYSEEEVKRLCKYAMEFAQERREYAYELIDEWFEQNKKK